ncbi:MAG TPA: serine hydrolase [Acidimicrobiia bacterium]|nr:serine hydrolase [Acidimicrobiia bacterium]
MFSLVFAVGGWRAGLSRLSDNSFFWHLRTGRLILDHGIPHADPYSFTAAGHRWVAQSWLAEALYGAIDKVAGAFGLRLLTALTGSVVAAVTYQLVHRISRDRLAAVGLTLAAIGASFTLWSARPLFLGILAFLGLLWIVEVPDSWLGRRAVWTIPVLIWLWANIHGTFSLGLAYLGLHVLGRWLEGAPFWRGRERVLTQAAVIAVVVAALNPYGPGLLLFPVELLGRGDILKRVTEWRSPDFRTIQGLMFAGWTAVFVACFALGHRRPTRRDVVVTVPFLLLAFWAQRNIALAPLVGVAAAARCVGRDQYRPPSDAPLNRIVAVALLGLGLVWTAQAAGERNFDDSIYPVTAMQFVIDHGLLGQRLLTDDAWGGYVILKFWPAQKVFVDDRYDMYPRPVLDDFIRFSDADPRWREILDRNRIDVVVWPVKAPVVGLLDTDPGWTEVHRDKRAAVFTRRAPTPVAPAPVPPPAPPPAPGAGLGPAIDGFLAGAPVPFSVVSRMLPDGPEVARSADRTVLSASLYKLFVARELVRRIHAGTLDRAAPAGPTGRTAGDCLRAMIVVSDNLCGVWGLGEVGGGRLDAVLARDGYPGTTLASPQQTTAADVARFFERARAGTLLGPGGEAATAELFGLLRDQQVNDRLPVGLPAGTPIAHKTGDRRHWAHDAGIITAPGGDVLLVVLSGPWPEPCCDADHPGPGEQRAFGAIADLARRVWAAVG